MGIRGHMTRSDFGKCSTLAAAVLTILVAGAFDARAQQAIKNGDVLTGPLNAMRSRAKGKRVNTFQLVSGPRRLPSPNGLCNLETGPETFQIVTSNDAVVSPGTAVSTDAVVIARLDRANQYAVTSRIFTKFSGILDHPLSRVMTTEIVERLCASQGCSRAETFTVPSVSKC